MATRQLGVTRREALRLAGAGLFGPSLAGWLAATAADHPQRKRSCVVLWMAGGPSQTDTFGPKPGHANAGPFKAIDSAVPGVHIAEHLPLVAAPMNDLAVVRSMATRECCTCVPATSPKAPSTSRPSVR
jgi:hypothetical protein